MRPRLILFDLDGTLVDSVPDLAFAVDAMLADIGAEPAGIDQVRLWVGNGADMLVRRALSKSMLPDAIELADFEFAKERFFHHYQLVNGAYSQLYPQVLATLIPLRETIPLMGLVTNKPEQFTFPLLSMLGLPSFDLVVGGDTLSAKKPDPAQLLYCMQKLGCKSHEAILVGDSVNDIQAAKAAGVRSVCVTYGYHQGEDLSAYRPDYLIEQFASLLDIVASLSHNS